MRLLARATGRSVATRSAGQRRDERRKSEHMFVRVASHRHTRQWPVIQGKLEPCVVASPSSPRRSAWPDLLDAALAAGLDPEGHPSWNVGPQRRSSGSPSTTARASSTATAGVSCPSWAKDPAIGNRLFNARGETVAEKPSFPQRLRQASLRDPRRRFLRVGPPSGRSTASRTSSRASTTSRMLFAGLYEYWRDPEPTKPRSRSRRAPSSPPPRARTWTRSTTACPWCSSARRRDLARRQRPRARRARCSCSPGARGHAPHYGVDEAVGSVKNDGPDSSSRSRAVSRLFYS